MYKIKKLGRTESRLIFVQFIFLKKINVGIFVGVF